MLVHAQPVHVAPTARFADGALAALLTGGGELVADRRPMPVGRLRYFAEPCRRRDGSPTGAVIIEVVESPYGSERDVLETEEQRLRGLGYRARAFAGYSRLLIAPTRRARGPGVVAAKALNGAVARAA